MKRKNTDEKLLTFFQKLSDWFQISFGIDNFVIAKFLIVFAGFSLVCQGVYSYFLKGVHEYTITVLLLIALYLVAVVYIAYAINQGESSFRNNPAFTNPNVVKLAWLRNIFCLWLPITVIIIVFNFFPSPSETFNKSMAKIFWNLTQVSYISAVYFGSCTPKPPAKSKLNKLKESLAHFGKVPRLSVAKE